RTASCAPADAKTQSRSTWSCYLPTRPSGIQPEETDMRISAKADYAVRAAVELAAAPDDRPIKAERIATNQQIPLNFLENILGELRHAGIVRSHRGADGGLRAGGSTN